QVFRRCGGRGGLGGCSRPCCCHAQGNQERAYLPRRQALIGLRHRGHEAIAPTVPRLDHALRLPRVSNCPAGLLNTRLQRRLANELLGPQVLEEILLGDNAVAMGDEVVQDVEDLRAERNTPASAAQFTAAYIQRIVTKEILHGACPSACNDAVLRTRLTVDSHEITTKIPHLCHQSIMLLRLWRRTFPPPCLVVQEAVRDPRVWQT